MLCDLLRIRLYSDLGRLRLCRSTLSTRILFLLVRPLPHLLSDGWASLGLTVGLSNVFFCIRLTLSFPHVLDLNSRGLGVSDPRLLFATVFSLQPRAHFALRFPFFRTMLQWCCWAFFLTSLFPLARRPSEASGLLLRVLGSALLPWCLWLRRRLARLHTRSPWIVFVPDTSCSASKRSAAALLIGECRALSTRVCSWSSRFVLTSGLPAPPLASTRRPLFSVYSWPFGPVAVVRDRAEKVRHGFPVFVFCLKPSGLPGVRCYLV